MTEVDYTYFAYLDVLGYKNFLEKDRSNGTITFKDKLLNAFRVFDGVNNTVYQYRAVSDSMFITCTDRGMFIQFLELIKKIYVSFLNQGIFLRGGLSYGQHFENDRITYSQVLTKAHELGEKFAEYPRVIIDKNIILMLEEKKADIINSKLVLKSGNMYFLNIVDQSNWEAIFDSAKSIYDNDLENISEDERAMMKHMWFQKYLIESKPDECEERERYINIFSSW